MVKSEDIAIVLQASVSHSLRGQAGLVMELLFPKLIVPHLTPSFKLRALLVKLDGLVLAGADAWYFPVTNHLCFNAESA